MTFIYTYYILLNISCVLDNINFGFILSTSLEIVLHASKFIEHSTNPIISHGQYNPKQQILFFPFITGKTQDESIKNNLCQNSNKSFILLEFVMCPLDWKFNINAILFGIRSPGRIEVMRILQNLHVLMAIMIE